MPSPVVEALERVTRELPGAEARPGQVAMAEAVAAAIANGEHVLVQAGTGTGKSLSYLVPAILSGQRTVVATATKALQEQLTTKDLPFLAKHLGVPFTFALLKGRSNYYCLARAAEMRDDAAAQLIDTGPSSAEVTKVALWAATSSTGDRADAPHAIPNHVWQALSVSARECPGAPKCKYGEECFAEKARQAAAAADVIVVNTHLYAMHLASGGFVLPEHDVVIIDEAHALEDIAADSLAIDIGASRASHLAGALRGLFTRESETASGVEGAGAAVEVALSPFADQRLSPGEGAVGTSLVRLSEVVASARREVAALPKEGPVASKRMRTLQLADALLGDLRRVQETMAGDVTWVERAPAPTLRLAPVDIGPLLAGSLFANHTVVLTSATLAVGGEFRSVAFRVGLRDDDQKFATLDAGSPFDFGTQGLLYCAAHLPDPRAANYQEAVAAELARLIDTAGGRTLALFTSRRALDDAVRRLRDTITFTMLVQDEQPRTKLLRTFIDDETSCLFATMGFWQGIDVPGPALSLVAIDRLPFPRPDDPLLSARRDAAAARGESPFHVIDVPRAATLLAQGVGRLIRSTADRGVVAVLDRRLATAPYRWTLVNSLPPLRRTRDFEVVAAFLRDLAAERSSA
jgi:ATP-dependent DNA helicase DinG